MHGQNHIKIVFMCFVRISQEQSFNFLSSVNRMHWQCRIIVFCLR